MKKDNKNKIKQKKETTRGSIKKMYGSNRRDVAKDWMRGDEVEGMVQQ